MGIMLSLKLRELTPFGSPEGRQLGWWCPGCKGAHVVSVEKPNASGAKWLYDGNAGSPTISPSYHQSVGPWSDGIETHPKRTTCHCWIRGGRIQFLGDSAHNLAGQTVDMIDWPPMRRSSDTEQG